MTTIEKRLALMNFIMMQMTEQDMRDYVADCLLDELKNPTVVQSYMEEYCLSMEDLEVENV